MNDITTMKDKIAKLLAKAEGTDNEHERDTYVAHAERLMLKLGIDAAELEAAGTVKPEEIVQVHRDYSGGYSIVMIPFVSSLAWGFGNLKTLQSKYGTRRRSYIIGHKSDVEAFVQLLDSLEKQAMSALHRWQKTAPERSWQNAGERTIGSRTFLSAFGSTVGTRLRELREETQAEASAGAALVLVSKAERVEDKVAEMHPNLRSARGGAKRYDYAGASAGRAAGQRASLGEKAVGGTRGALR